MMVTRSIFNEQLEALQERILEMATCADAMVGDAVHSLMSGDTELAREVVRRDASVDKIDLDVESACLRLIVTQQPVAHDLRVIGTALKAITDIERIGDYAVDIAKIGRRLSKSGASYRPLVDLPRLTQLSREMLRDALQAFVRRDMQLVDRVIQSDDAVDRLYHEMRALLINKMGEDPDSSVLAINVLFAAKYLERISDHVVNIADRVRFMETGELKQTPMWASTAPAEDF